MATKRVAVQELFGYRGRVLSAGTVIEVDEADLPDLLRRKLVREISTTFSRKKRTYQRRDLKAEE